MPRGKFAVGAGEAVVCRQAQIVMTLADWLQIQLARTTQGFEHPVEQRLCGPIRRGRVWAIKHQGVGIRQRWGHIGKPRQLSQQDLQ
ncbi:hypothetical protein D3C78_1552510 [compost metagenome]